MKPSLEGWLTKAKEAHSPHEVRLTKLSPRHYRRWRSVGAHPLKKKKKKKTDQAGHHPSISMSREFQTCFTSENNYLFSLIIFYDYTTDIVYIIDFYN